jgi:hypothetical protein
MLVNFVGDVGSGKTLFTTGLALNETRQVLANYELKIPNYVKLKPEMLFDEKLPPSLVILDEAYAWLESRKSGTPMPIYMSYILFQSRKRFIDILMTDQLEGTIETRYRQMLNWRVECNEEKGLGFSYYFFKRARGGFLGPFRYFLPLQNAEKIFPFYNTLEIIDPMDKELIYKISEDKQETVDVVDSIVEEILSKFPLNAVKKAVIADYCLRNKHPHYLVELVFNRIKTKIAENIYYPTYNKRLKRGESHT